MASDENVYRGVFPSDRKNSTVKRSAVAARHLWTDELSVWGACSLVGTSLEELIAFIDPLMVRPRGERFDELRFAPASLIRDHEVDGKGERSFSILDECTYNDQGDKHPAHAHIAICERLKAQNTFQDETFLALQEALKLLLAQGTLVWRRQ
jgi:hypothetical protein